MSISRCTYIYCSGSLQPLATAAAACAHVIFPRAWCVSKYDNSLFWACSLQGDASWQDCGAGNQPAAVCRLSGQSVVHRRGPHPGVRDICRPAACRWTLRSHDEGGTGARVRCANRQSSCRNSRNSYAATGSLHVCRLNACLGPCEASASRSRIARGVWC